MKELITSAVLVLLAQFAVQAFAVPSVDATTPAESIRQRCMLACPPGQSLHPKECYCVGEPNLQKCPLIRCPYLFIPCDKYKVDKDGCPTCECQCSSLLSSCPTDCEHGTERTTDSNGCKVCKCKENPDCPLIRCPYQYNPCDKYKVDKDGCPTCECLCSSFLSGCPTDCEHGTEKTTNSNGCNVCKCKEKPVCPRIKCPYLFIPCDKYKEDKDGCPTCDCQCSSLLSRCPTDCEHGTERTTDTNGCRVCRCKKNSSSCPQVRCENACKYGRVTDKDGCPTCECKLKPVSLKCGPVCAIACPFGNVLDSRGCPTCKCKSGTIKERKD